MNPDSNAGRAAAIPESRGGKRRARIMAAFHDCIIDKGYAKTTLRDVAREAGMSPSHLLYYFSGKDTLLEQYFDRVSKRIIERIGSFRKERPKKQIELLADLFFAGKGITRSEIGFMLECFGVAVHDDQLQADKTDLDRFCKSYLRELFRNSPADPDRAGDLAEISYALLIGLRTAAYFDNRLGIPRSRNLFHDEMLSLAGYREKV